MMIYYLLLLWWTCGAARECNLEDELPCVTSDSCIHRLQWCDYEYDCSDQSDELYCSVAECPNGLFLCENRRCIYNFGRCDGRDDCGDGSDEEKCEINKAAAYLLKKGSDNEWNNFLPRAIVALTFAERAGALDGEQMSLLKKQLNVKIALNLMQTNGRPRLCDTAHYINALSATCEDPRDFNGLNLVQLLRSEVDAAKDIELPYAFLTLCINQNIKEEDTARLISMYEAESAKLSSRSLTAMALSCITKSTQDESRGEIYFRNFWRDTNLQAGAADFYSKALHYQALIALGYKVKMDLTQQPDGSFGDMLATYYAIPLLANSTLLDLRCRKDQREATPPAVHFSDYNKNPKVTLSLWIDKDDYVNTHSITVPVKGNVTFYDVMRIAESINPMFSFLCDPSTEGKKVYSIGGIPNDAEAGKAWTLYHGSKNSATLNLKKSLSKLDIGVDRIHPTDGDAYAYWFERI